MLLLTFADKILHDGTTDPGILYPVPAIGSIIGAVVTMGISNHIHTPDFSLLTAIVAFGLARSVIMAILFLAVTGLIDMVSMTSQDQRLQLLTSDVPRGRITAAHHVFVQGGVSLGQLEAGTVAAGFDMLFSIISGGVACMSSRITQ